MTRNKKASPAKKTRRLMKADREFVINVLRGVAAGLRASAKAKFEEAVQQSINDGSLDSREAHQHQLACYALDMAAQTIDVRIGKLRKTWT